MNFDRILQLPIFRNSTMDWATALGIALTSFAVMLAVRRLVRTQHARLAATPEVELLELPLGVLSRTTTMFFIALALFFGFNALTVSANTRRVIDTAIIIAVFWQAGVWASAIVAVWLDRKRKRNHLGNMAAVSSLGIIDFIARALIWSLVLLLTLDNLGINITALVAGLGVGGIAVALAVQNVLGDLLASLSITLDRPFVIGDFLIVDDILGSVEHIGVKSTRLRSLSGEQIIMSNTDLLKSRVRNYGRMNERRVLFSFGITYETAPERVEQTPQWVREIIESHSNVRFDRCHFARYGAASLDFEVVYYVLSADYNQYMDIQQSINLKIFRKFAALGIEFAYPTQKLYVVRTATQPNQDENAS